MGKKGKISLFVFLLLLALIVLVHVQARRVMLALIETQAAENVETKIGSIQLRPLNQTILLKDVSVSINDKDGPGFRKASVKRVHLEMGSLWAFFFGGTLAIDKMECDGGELIMARSSVREPDTTARESFDLSVVFEGLRKNAIRFRIQEMSFRDFNLTLLNDSTRSPTLVKHLQFRARDLYLSADSILKRMPYIECGLPSQQIEFPNGTTTIKFDSLFFSTSDNSIQLNEAELVMSDEESGSQYRINSDKVRVAYFDFESLFAKGLTIVDSVFLGRSKLEAKVNVEQRSKIVNKNAPSHNTIPYLLIRNLMVRQLAANVQLKQNKIENSFTINHSSVTIQHLEHSPDSSQRLSAKNFDILISDYETLLNNKNTSITFDTVRLHRHGLALLNFNISKAAQARPILQTAVFELRDVDWYTLLFFKKLVAKEAIAINPIVNTTFMAPAGEGGSSQELVVLESLKELLDVNLFSLKNASAILRFDEGRTTAALRGINASILVNRMIESKTFNDALDATPEFSFRNFALKSNDMDGRIEDFTLQQGKFYFGTVDLADGDKLDLKLKELNVDHITYDHSRNNIAVAGLAWQSAVVRIKSETGNNTLTNRRLPEISLSMLRGENTQVHYSSQDLIANAYFDEIQTNILLLGDSITVGGVHIVGNNLNINKDSASLSVKRFSFAENGSVVENIQWNKNGTDTLDTAIEQISFITDFNLLAKQKFSFSRVDVTGWRVAYQKRDSSHTILIKVKTSLLAKDVRYEKKKFTLGSLNQTFDSVYYLDEKQIKRAVEVAESTPVNERWKIRDDVDSIFDTGNSVGVLLPISAKGARPSFGTPTESPFSMLSTKVESGQNGIVISVSNIQAFSKDSLQVTGQIDSIRFRGIHFNHNDIHTRIDHGAVTGLSAHSAWVRQPMEMFRANYPTAAIVNLKLHVETDKNLFKFDRLDYYPLRAAGSIYGLEFRPLKDKQAFLDESFFQTNYMHTKIESLSFEKWDPERYLNDSTIHLRVVRVNGPGLEIGRDKTHPFYSSRIKLLPTNSFQKLGVKFKVDSLQIQNGNITYTEKSKVTSKEGLIHFTNVQGLVRNIKNVEMKTMDTLFLEASARFLDSAKVNLRVRESYHDTLAGFLMTTQVSPFHTSILNPVLVPLVSVEFQSGFVDTLQMHALGREHIALGRMKFLYRDLKVNFLDQNDTARHSIKNYILKFAANNLVIKTNNKKRIGDVMELRDRHRAVFQYWVKMILSGVTTSVGAKSNRSQMKKYARELNTRKIPPIEVPLSGF